MLFAAVPSLSAAALARAAMGTDGILLYGAGMYGQRLAEILAGWGHKIEGYVDRNPELWGGAISGVPIISPAEAGRAFGAKALFVIALAKYSLLPEEHVRRDIADPLARHGAGHIAFVPNLHEALGRFDCEAAGVDSAGEEILLPGHPPYQLPNFFRHPDATVRNGFGLILSETLLPTTDAGATFYGRGYDLPGPTALRAGDVVADCGANLGVFCAYAAARGCTVHAFEPIPALAELLRRTAGLYPERIFVHEMAVGREVGECAFAVSEMNAAWGARADSGQNAEANDAARKPGAAAPASTIRVAVTSLDAFAEKEGLTKLDFVKSDIEGEERNMLAGAAGVLARLEPRLAISSYHLPDDPEVLEAAVLAANPRYRTRRLDDKLYAWTEE